MLACKKWLSRRVQNGPSCLPALPWREGWERRRIWVEWRWYTPGRQEIQSLLVAAPLQERLEYAGRLSCGWTRAQKAQLAPLLASRIRAHSAVPCPKKARWVEPDLYCRVQFLQRIPRGRLRGASFRGLIDGLT